MGYTHTCEKQIQMLYHLLNISALVIIENHTCNNLIFNSLCMLEISLPIIKTNKRWFACACSTFYFCIVKENNNL